MKLRQRRFTLIEVLCVIVVIAVIVSMLFPAFSRARKKTQLVLCGNNLHQTFIGAMNSAQNNKGNFVWTSPNKGFGNNGLLAALEGNDAIWSPQSGYMAQGVLYKDGYITDARVLYCPSAPPKCTYGTYIGLEIRFDGKGVGSPSELGKTGVTWINSSYAWNGSVNAIPGEAYGRNPKTSDSGQTPLSVDSMCQLLHSDGFMVLRLDGSCNWNKTDPMSILPNVPNYGWTPMYNYGWNGAFK